MANVVILKQPLYGSVIWNGIEFEYTPNPDFTGNDTYTYKITDINGTRVLTNYVNPTNLPPVTKNITVNALSNSLTEVDLSSIIDDNTDPFEYLTITNVKSDMVVGSVRTDGKKIYFLAGYYNSTEYVDYTISDKQFEVSGRITFNIIGGLDPASYKGSPYSRFGSLLDKTAQIRPLTSGWSSMYSVMAERGPIWDTIDAHRYNMMSNVVSGSSDANYIKWNNAFLNVDKFEDFSTNITANSSTWEDYHILGYDVYNLIDNVIATQNSEYDFLSQKNSIWSSNIYNTNSLSSIHERIYNNMFSTSTTIVENSGDKWDSTELNNILDNRFGTWLGLDYLLHIQGKAAEWNKNSIDFDLLSAEIKPITDNISNTNILITNNSGYWDSSEFNSFSADNFDKWNDWHNLISLSSNSWYDPNNVNFVTDYNSSSAYNDVYTTVLSNSSNWGHTGFDTYSAENVTKWDSVRQTINDNINNWGTFTYTDLTSFSASYYNDTPKYTDTHNTANEYSYRWGHTTFDPYSAKNFPKWDYLPPKILDIQSTQTLLCTFSSVYFKNSVLFNDLYSTVYTKASTDWDLSFVSKISSYIQSFDDGYDVIINTSNNTDKWDETYSLTNAFSNSYANAYPKYNSYTSTVGQNASFWEDKSASTVLSGNSAKWQEISLNSDKWSFDEKASLVNVQTTVITNSSQWNDSKQIVSVSGNSWSDINSLVSSISSDYLSGSNTITLSTKDLFVYGNTNIKGNLSALGKRIKVDTSLYTISGFNITNTGTSYALNVQKNGGFDRAIANFDTLTSTVLYVKTTNSVGINLSSFPSTNALTVSGNISASGSIYPIDPSVTTHTANSGKYTSTYNYVTGISSNFYSVCALSANYKELTNFITLSADNLTKAKTNVELYNLMLSSTRANSGNNDTINQYITANGAYFGIDPHFRNNKEKHDNMYSVASALSSKSKSYNINVLFSYPMVVQSQKINYVVQDNVKITSWTMISDVPTIAQIKILSASKADYPTVDDITNNINEPHLDMTNSDGKNYNNNLRFWKGTNIQADTILQFMLTNNSLASSIMISLKVDKL